MKAELLLRRRVVLAVDAFVELVIWQLPGPVPPSAHASKYRPAYVVKGVCVLRYDNERGKGGHRHWGAHERVYSFLSPEQLMRDFHTDVRRWNDEHGRS